MHCEQGFSLLFIIMFFLLFDFFFLMTSLNQILKCSLSKSNAFVREFWQWFYSDSIIHIWKSQVNNRDSLLFCIQTVRKSFDMDICLLIMLKQMEVYFRDLNSKNLPLFFFPFGRCFIDFPCEIQDSLCPNLEPSY